MAKPVRRGAGSGGDADMYKSAKDAKELLDMIGKDVHDQVEKEAKERNKGELKGNLTSATEGSSELIDSLDPCTFEYDKHTTSANVNTKPCEKDGNVDRFSDKEGAECATSKIKDSKNYRGACAPYRRLHVCDKNMEKIPTSMTTHKLLAEVCYAAKYEGESISLYYPQYQNKYHDTGFTTCTMLARSFADIGDIVRGRDLYRGDNKKDKAQKLKLQDNLNKIFKNIKNTNSRLTDLTDDQIREYWWALNRQDVWKALTCKADNSNRYFRQTCNDNESLSHASHKCRCKKKDNTPDDQVPTYFDYVPQYLRWFEEWAEDFCRKRKHKLKDAIKKCREGRDEKDQPIYCDLNRHDCVKTIRGDHIFVERTECHDCSVACKPFVKWIDKQKVEFDKQKRKYADEMKKYKNGGGGSGRRRRRRDARSSGNNSNYDGYESKFYNILKGTNYKNVEDFLKKLNDEAICKDQPQVGNEIADPVDFTEDTHTTFSHTKYCQACPWCGAEPKRDGGGWKDTEDTECDPGKSYKNYENTQIPILTGDKEQLDILKKYKKFCNGNGEKGANGGAPGGKGENGASGKNGDNITETWQCYYEKKENNDGKEDINFCVLQNNETGTSKKNSMSYNAFFWDWVYHMLHDSLDWRKQLGNCINDAKSGQCENKCNSKCECFEKWVVKKKEEWKNIKIHFKKQKDIPAQMHDITLELLLKKDLLLKSIEDTHADAKDIKHIKDLLEKEETAGVLVVASSGEDNTTIDKLLKHEEDEATKCKKCQEPPKPPAGESPGRSAVPSPDSPPPVIPAGNGGDADSDDDNHSSEEEDDEDDEEEEEEEEPQKEEETANGEPQKEASPTPAPTVENICDTVKSALTSGNLNTACTQKYGGNNSRLGWKCIPSGTTSGDATGGSICVPPRRRRLYVTPLTKLTGDNTETSQGEKSPQGTPPATSSRAQSDPLLTAFVESAAVETFFLWDRYKKLNTPQSGSLLGVAAAQLPQQPDGAGGSEQTPQTQLQSGTIPPDFLRQMFYTLGDYRDLCVGVKDDVAEALKASGDNKSSKNPMQEISEKIKSVIENSGEQPPPAKKNPGQTTKPEEWWNDTLGPAVWNGMICALTYDTDSGGKEQAPTQNEKVRKAFFGDNNKPKETKYEYKNVKLEDESGSKPTTTTQIASPSSENTPLTQFVLRPPYFRYLEEWGQNFCKERKKRLDQIYRECKVGQGNGKNGNKKCSGYGEHCDDQLKDNPSTLSDLMCQDCGKYCSFYKKWINTKRDEFNKQSNAYSEQKKKYEDESNGAGRNNGGNGFCGTIKTTSTTAKDFLQKLGSCSKTNNGGSEITFDDSGDTFKPAENCKPCSEFKIKCNGNDHCDNSNGNNCKDNKITAEKIAKLSDSTVLDMRVSDSNTTGFEDLNKCTNADIFKGIRKEQWECGNFCGYVVCKRDKVEGRANGEKQIITIKALLHRWLQYFLEDYNKINKKLKTCTNDKGSKCITECVDTWISNKQQERKNIKDHYQKQYGVNDSNNSFSVKTILEEFKDRTELNKAIKPCKDLGQFENSIHCNGAASSEKGIQGTQKDIVECLLDKLKKKIETSKSQHQNSGEPGQPCGDSLPLGDEDDEPLEEENPENKVGKPAICGNVDTTEEEETDDKCGKQDEEEKEDKDGVPAPKETAQPQPPAPAPGPVPGPPKEQETSPSSPPLSDQPTNSISDILSSTIPFGIAIALTSIVFLFLKVIHIVVYIYNEWNTLKDEFISNMLQNTQNTEPNILHDNVDNNTNPKTLHVSMDEKPFIMSIHDRDLYTGEEINYSINMVNNDNIPINSHNNVYSGIDLINDALSGDYDIYDELLKRKENELFGTNHVKQTSIHSVAKLISGAPIHNQLELFHKWLDRHRDMCEKWENHHERLAKLKEEWENETHSGNTHPSDSNKTLNTDIWKNIMNLIMMCKMIFIMM
ncbi:hypothetical protein PFBG_00170 [Plasmodium falciparum 7G8]|uniref:Erythrocyte membrane protein 1 n=1 Tax=Plasmodium falciparum (isolate 7G8) TaxID=57266 RepID=W7FUX4_PLAF8|nr:hypothetical protein PFBG_00170 [Plasmodium falciparum 7G8]